MGDFAADARGLAADVGAAMKLLQRSLAAAGKHVASSSGIHRAPLPAIGCALASGLLLLVSSGFQLAASNSRWITHAAGVGDYAIEDNRFDYYLAADPVILLPGTHLPFGIGMLLQAAGLAFLTAAVLMLRPRASAAVRRAQLLLGAAVAAGFALIGADSLRIAATGQISEASATDWLVVAIVFLTSPALLALGIMAWLRVPAVGIAMLFAQCASPIGYLAIAVLFAPAITGYAPYDATPGTETIVAIGSAAAGAAALLAAVQLIRKRRSGRDRNNE